jgi:hypothetical protein
MATYPDWFHDRQLIRFRRRLQDAYANLAKLEGEHPSSPVTSDDVKHARMLTWEAETLLAARIGELEIEAAAAHTRP